jgi:SAM-dependent methyltransferase
MARLPWIVEWAHLALERLVHRDGLVIDATVGNGQDSLFLTRLIGGTGHLFGFDIQENALAWSRKTLTEAGVSETQFTFFLQSHAEMPLYLPARTQKAVNAIVFNLGYLPGGDKSVTTLAQTTLAALTSSMELLAPGGVISITTYPGHDTGLHEASAVSKWVESLPSSQTEIHRICAIKTLTPAPELWLLLKRN